MNFVLFLLLIATSLCFSASYEDLEMKPSSSVFRENVQAFFDGHGFSELRSEEEFPAIGINQIFFKTLSDSFITVKYDVRGEFPQNEVIETGAGVVFHTRILDVTAAFYFHRIPDSDVRIITEELRREEWKTKTTSILKLMSPLASAHADDCDTGPGSAVLSSSAVKSMAAIGADVVASSLYSCLKGAKESAASSLDVVGGAKSAQKSLASFLANPTKSISSFYQGVSSGVVGFVSLIQVLGRALIDPQNGLPALKQTLGQAGAFLSDAVAMALSFPPNVAVSLVCNFVTGIGVNALIGAVSGGVAGLAMIVKLKKVLSSMEAFQKIADVMRKLKLSSLNQLGLGPESQSRLMNKLMAGSLDTRKFKIFATSLDSESSLARSLALRGLQCSL